MKPGGSLISWKHFENLYGIDRNMPMPICSKITKHHLELKNSSKMRVRLAVQVISMVCTTAIKKFYFEYNIHHSRFLAIPLQKDYAITVHMIIN